MIFAFLNQLYLNKFRRSSPLHSNRTALRAIDAFVIKFTAASFIISCVWPIKLKRKNMERQNRVGRRCNDEDDMRAVFLFF